MSPVETLHQLRQRTLLTVSDFLKEGHVAASDDLQRAEGDQVFHSCRRGGETDTPSFSRITLGATKRCGCYIAHVTDIPSFTSCFFLSFFFFCYSWRSEGPDVSGVSAPA